MADLTDFRRVARDVSNWGRWGNDDELGTLNFITADKVAQAAGLVKHGKVFPLGVDFGSSGPQGAFGFRHNPMLLMTVDGGDASSLPQYGPEWTQNPTARQLGNYFVDNLFRFNEDMIIMPLQAATQWDALSHVYYEGKLYNGFSSGSVTSMGAYHCSIDKVDVKGITSRGVLLDLVRHRNAEVFLEQGNPITPEELDDVVRAQRVTVESGDIVLIRTGWWTRFLQTGNKTEPFSGLHWRCASWLHDREVAAVASDNLQVEDLVPDVEGAFLPLHLLCLRDMGLMLGEYWDLTALADDCAADGVYEFQLVAPPLRFVGAVGSPVNPIAIK
ncbi:cyclase family protein [Mycobacterium mantenii]|uniref:Cyclase n=1 Tax=Mycobacterium mantenii TaxID=560555 RepID=A0A1A2TJH7_MYCNT|nr:cyclase family protein [Mycobacterium mantenii]OBH40548.1 cyclase [Mycobacterium mantenii]OBH54179.1 cyclase [Mycobacterium mantenii]OBH75650.1 cyclase [Mycobacterium mantenii]OBH76593.1 cyclase [Mycobacterium mantenii]